MVSILKSFVALYGAMVLVSMSLGLLATFLSLRLTVEGFSTHVTGLILTAYFMGSVVGTFYCRRLINAVGHIRSFAAFAALATAMVMLHGWYMSALAWGIFRFFTGIATIGLYMVIESWLNGCTQPGSRGRVFSMYMIMCYLGGSVGQQCLNLGDVRDSTLFFVVGFFLVCCIIPVTLTRSIRPELPEVRVIDLKTIFKKAPMGLLGCFLAGLVSSAFYTMGPVFCHQIHLSVSQLSWFMTITVLGGLLLQWPMGLFSDRFDRSIVIPSLGAVFAVVSGLMIFAVQRSFDLLMVAMILFGGLLFCIYPVAVARAHDMFEPKDVVNVSSALLLFYGIGSVAGPLVSSLIIEWVGNPSGFYLFFFSHGSVYNFFSYSDVFFLINMLKILKVILFCIIFYICYYAYISYGKYRMKMYSIVFLIVAIGETVMFTRFATSNDSNMMLIYTTINNLIIASGILLGGTISVDVREMKENHKDFDYYGFAFIILVIYVVFSSENVHNIIFGRYGVNIFRIMLEYIIIGSVTVAMVLYLKRSYEYKNKYFLKFASGLIFLIFSQSFRLIYDLDNQVSYMMYNLYTVLGFLILSNSLYGNNIKVPFYNIINAENQIKLYAENLEKIINKRTHEIKQVNNRLIKELEYAKRIQQSLLPLKRLSFKNTVFVSEFFPCERLSGDFYDIYRIDDDNIGMYVLDVSGHGISAALMTMFCNNYIKSTERLIKRYRGLKPHRNLRHFYEEFNKMNFPEEMHMVIFFASYNIESEILTYCSGGMNCYPILFRRSGDVIYLSESEGFPICKMDDFYVPEYVSANIKLEKGDRVIFYTDGLIDSHKNKVMDEDELIEIINSFSDKPLRELNMEIQERINSYSDNLEDDITYFIMEI